MIFLPENRLIDFHCHMLPGVDDGAQSMDEAIKMARLSVNSGVGTVVVTPHANQRGRFENYSSQRMQYIYEAFCLELRKHNIPLQVLQGMEIYASDDIVQLIEDRKVCPLAGTRYYLIEFPFGAYTADIECVLKKMLLCQFVPVIAHLERYVCVQNDPDRVAVWRNMGCVSQVNRGSLQGGFGSRCQQTAIALLNRGQIDVFGTDAHGINRRTPEMGSLYEYLVYWGGEEKAKRLMIRNPARLLRNEQLTD